MDYSEKSDGVRGASDADSGAESINMQQKSLVDMDEDFDSDSSEEVSANQAKESASFKRACRLSAVWFHKCAGISSTFTFMAFV